MNGIIDKHISKKDSAKTGYNRRLITLSVPEDVKKDFEQLQAQTNNQFVKALKEITEMAIALAKSKVDKAS